MVNLKMYEYWKRIIINKQNTKVVLRKKILHFRATNCSLYKKKSEKGPMKTYRVLKNTIINCEI